jgi:hypothetical protein
MIESPLFTEDMDYQVRPDGIHNFQRRVFCRDYFHYKPGEHVVFGGPSTRGKTTMAFDLMEYIVSPDFPAYMAASKPRDEVTEQRAEQLGFRRVSDWPPPIRIQELFGQQKPSGFLVWSQFGDLKTDMQRAAIVTEKLMMERYASGASKKSKGGLLVMDDTMVKAKIMGLDNEMVTILAMAGAMDLGLWIFVQKPTDSGRTPLWGFENATHLFFTKGGDTAMLRRYSEIIGDKGKIAIQIIPTLKPFEFLYVHKTEGWMCIVGAS